MFNDETGQAGEASQPRAEIPPLGSEGKAPASGRGGLKRPAAIVAITTSLVVLVAAAVIIPMKLASARSLSAATDGVLSHRTVRVVLTERGTPQVKGFALSVALASTNGRLLSSERVRVDEETSVAYRGTSYGQLFLSRSAICLRLDVTAIDRLMRARGEDQSLRSILDRASRYRHLAYLRALARGKWVGLKLKPLRRLALRLLRRNAVSRAVVAKSAQLRSGIGNSFAATWDEVASLHEHAAGHGATEYFVSLPVRRFVATFAGKLERRIGHSFPVLRREFPTVRHAISRIPSRLSLPVELWVRHGQLTKVSASYGGHGVVIRISHPNSLVRPAHVTYVTLRDLRFLQQLVVGVIPTTSLSVGGRSQATFVPSPFFSGGRLSAAQSIMRAEIAAGMIFGMDHGSFAQLTGPSARQVLRQLHEVFVSGRISTSPDVVSVHVAPSTTAVTLEVYSPGSRRCYGDVLNMVRQERSIGGAPTAQGSFSFERSDVPASACDATNLAGIRHFSRGAVESDSVTGSSSR